MIDELALQQWLTALTVGGSLAADGVPFETGPEIREYADADVAGTVTLLAGFGLTNEGLFDVPQFQVRVRAREHQLVELRETVGLIDRALIRDVAGQALWGTWVVIAGRSGGQPAPFPEDTRERRSYACTYFAKVEL